MGYGALMGIPWRVPAVECIFDGNRPGKLFRSGDNPKRRAVRLSGSGIGGAGGAAEQFGWIATVRFAPLAMT
jgi:hypothetical protein